MIFDPRKPHRLPLLPPDLDWNKQVFVKPLLKAHKALAELKGYSFGMPNPLLLLSPAILRESLASSEIENIHTTLIDVLQNQLLQESEQRENDKEVLRYREAILWGFEQLSKVSLSSRLILGIHNKLLPSHAGFRRQQNAIAKGVTGEVLYTPPAVPEIPGLISNWEHFVNETPSHIDPLMATAISHYQFEAIHPFGDGNGRTGRILMVLQLLQAELLHWPILYISGFINQNRSDYYRLLRDITINGQWEDYILYILEGFYLQACETKKLLFEINTLFEKIKEQIKEKHKKIYSTDLVTLLFAYPIISPVKMGKELGIHYTTATRYLQTLVRGAFLNFKKVGKYKLYINKKLLYLFSNSTVN